MAIVALLLFPKGLFGAGRLIINEVMINEPGSETSLEWVELFNAGFDSLNLQEFIFIEAADTTRFTRRWIMSREFVVLARRPVSTDGGASFERQWGNGSSVWGDDSLESYLLLPAKMSLRNSNDSVTIVDLSTGRVETVKWASSPPDGVSLERVNPGTDVTAKNFKQCKAASHSTPGSVNSVVAKMRDWGFNEDDCEIFVPPRADMPLEFRLAIQNCGQSILEKQAGIVVHDLDFDGEFGVVDSVTEFAIEPLLPDSESVAVVSFAETEGRHSYIIRLPEDDDSTNNEIRFECVIGAFARALLISEIMNVSADSLGCEWIEAQSIVPYRVPLNDWSLEIDGRRISLDSLGNVESGERVIVCEDSVCFRAGYTGTGCQLIQPESWRPLSDIQGTIALRMHLGALSDSVEYRGAIESGRSWERDFDSTGVVFASLFYRSTAIGGSTPCDDNSVRPVPVAVDIAFVPASLKLTVDSLEQSQIVASFRLVNYGYRESGVVAVHIFSDVDRDGIGSVHEWILDHQVWAIAGGDSEEVAIAIPASTGRKRLLFQLDDDEVSANNFAAGEITVGWLTREIVITEFLADPTGELESEWIEIRNVAGYPVDLSKWAIGDLSRQNLLQEATTLEAGHYCVIAQDKAAFRRYYDFGCVPFSCKSWSSLNNGGDCIVLRDEFGTISDSVSYAGGAGKNRSMELNEETVPGLSRWNPSQSPTGATPCGANSVLPAPAAFDAGFVENGVILQRDSVDAELIHFRVRVANFGYQDIEQIAIYIFDDRNRDGISGEDELLAQIEIDSLGNGDTTRVEFSLQIPAGRHALTLRLPDDEIAVNNECGAEITSGALLREIIFTEFLADPTGELESEWIEIRNVANYQIDLRGWMIGDLSRQNSIEAAPILRPGDYLVIAQDRAAFATYYVNGCLPFSCKSWSSLNNGGDCIVLRDEFGSISDSVSYSNCEGENRSIERNESAIEAASWYPSTSPAGATPCGENSVSGEYSGATSFVLLHRVFAPDAGEELRFAIQCPPASRFTIEVFDLAGRRQRVIADDEYFSSGEFSYDGLSDFYSHLPVGAYIIKVKSQDGSFSQKAGFAVAPPK